jgi:hypothetical protein
VETDNATVVAGVGGDALSSPPTRISESVSFFQDSNRVWTLKTIREAIKGLKNAHQFHTRTVRSRLPEISFVESNCNARIPLVCPVRVRISSAVSISQILMVAS